MFRIIPEGEDYREHVLLRDGEGIFFRPATEEDIPAIEGLLSRTSEESLWLRFMASVSQVPRSVLEQLCASDFDERCCLLAIIAGDEQRVVGMGNYVGLGHARAAEVAFLVEDAFQGRGISTLLLERLAGLAAARGYVAFEAEVLFDNQPMLSVFRSSGFEIHQAVEGGTIHVEFPVSGAAALRERGELRDRIAAANSLVPLLRPRSVAVVGASRDPAHPGNMIFRHLLASDFSGTVYPVNTGAESIHGVRAAASLEELPEAPDLAVIVVPAQQVQDVARRAAAAGVRGLVVVTSGFAEAGEDGRRLQRELVETVRGHGARMIGPNCLGVINTDPEVRLNASLAPALPLRRRIGFLSHSGGLGLVILDYATSLGLGFSTFVSAGNRADVSGNDLLQFWEEDPSTELVLLYVETFGNPRRFTRIARRVAQRKPIVCVKGVHGRTGNLAARLASGAVYEGREELDALFRQTGVIRAETLEEVFDIALLLAHQPLPRGERVSLVTNSGGVATLLVDACGANGLTVAAGAVSDLGPLATPEQYAEAVEQQMRSEESDALIVSYAGIGDRPAEPVAEAIRRGVGAARRAEAPEKPVLLCLMGAVGVVQPGASATEGELAEFPAYRFPGSAPRALGRVLEYSRFRSRRHGPIAWYEDADPGQARRLVHEHLAREDQGAPGLRLRGAEAAELLGCFGVPSADCEADEPPSAAMSLAIRTDRHFGPLIVVQRSPTRRVLRITPLTEGDIEQTLEALGKADSACVGALLGRLSQLIEELPWVWSLQGVVHDDGRSGVAALGAASITLRGLGAGGQRG